MPGLNRVSVKERNERIRSDLDTISEVPGHVEAEEAKVSFEAARAEVIVEAKKSQVKNLKRNRSNASLSISETELDKLLEETTNIRSSPNKDLEENSSNNKNKKPMRKRTRK